MSNVKPEQDLLALAAVIVEAHVSRTAVAAEALPQVIRLVYSALSNVGAPGAEAKPMEPAVPVKKSVFPDYLVCLEDGAKVKTLKRYLQTRYSMTPEDYRARWGLPPSYPMVAPNYAARRSAIAKEMGLGRKAEKPKTVEAPAPKPAEPARSKKTASAKRGR